MVEKKKEKTYKRELALVLLAVWCYALFTLDTETIKAITPWVFMYTFAAFGMDAYSKQIKTTNYGPFGAHTTQGQEFGVER